MLSNSDIIKRAYQLTIRHPILWVFGLFVVGGFNLNFLHVEKLFEVTPDSPSQIFGALTFFQQHPEKLALLSSAVLMFSILGILATNWAKILLVLSSRVVVEKDMVNIGRHVRPSLHVLWPVIKISLLTTSVMVAVTAVLFIPPLVLVESLRYQLPLFSIAAVLFLPLTFAISCISIFSTFFLVLFKQNLRSSFAQAADLFVTCWPRLLGFIVLLTLVYLGVFALGMGMLFFFRSLSSSLFELLTQGFGFPGFSGMIVVARGLSSLLVWILVAGLNVFLNIALLILFLQLVQPVEHKEVNVITEPVPNPTSV